MRVFILIVFSLFGSAFLIFKDPPYYSEVLLHVDTMNIYTDEFVYALKKNNYSQDRITKKDIDNYLDLFIRFKLKVLDAYYTGMDTSAAFIKEFNTYKDQLDQSYMKKDNLKDSLVKEIYNRMLWEINASHILMAIKNPDSPADTTEAFERINQIYQMAITGNPFSDLALYNSEDPSVKTNKGNLGYFTAMQMISSFEDMAYSTGINQVSKPFKTRFGYHILKIHDKRPNRGTVTVAHIMLRFVRGMTNEDSLSLEKKASDLYLQVKNNNSWDTICKQYSEDNNTRLKGGVLPSFGTGSMIPSFSEASFSLSNPGDISAPIKTPYGWHIIKLIEKKALPPYEELRPSIENQIEQDERSALIDQLYISGLKKEHNFRLSEDVFKKCLLLADSTLTEGKWKYENNLPILQETLIMIESNRVTVLDFFNYISGNQRPVRNMEPGIYMNRLFNDFSNLTITQFEKDHLGDKYPDYKMLVKEYKEGIMMFNLMDLKVWNMAMNDSAGLNNFYTNNQSNYRWNERVSAVIISADDTTIFPDIRMKLIDGFFPFDTVKIEMNSLSETMKFKIDSLYKLTISDTSLFLAFIFTENDQTRFMSDLIEYIVNMNYPDSEFYFPRVLTDKSFIQVYSNDKKTLKNLYKSHPELNLSIETGKFEKGSNEIIDLLEWKPGFYYVSTDTREYLIVIEKILPGDFKTLSETKGAVISDYQEYLEKQWISELKEQYPVKVNKKILEKIYREFEN